MLSRAAIPLLLLLAPAPWPSFLPRDAASYLERGRNSYRKGDYDAAIKDYDVAIRLNPKSSRSFRESRLRVREEGRMGPGDCGL